MRKLTTIFGAMLKPNQMMRSGATEMYGIV